MPRVQIEPMEWSTEFVPFMEDNWRQGEHIAVIAPTGEGKSTFTGGLMAVRRYVLVLDVKGGDSTLDGLGFPRLTSWPGKKKIESMLVDNDENNKPSRYVIGGENRTAADAAKLKSTIEATLRDAYEMGGFTVNADELQLLTDPRFMNLREHVDKILIAARDRRISFVGSYQAPSWVTPHASKQATWVAVAYTRDTDVVNRLAEILGRPKSEIRGAVEGLDKHHFIVANRNPREPLRLTMPDYIPPKRSSEDAK